MARRQHNDVQPQCIVLASQYNWFAKQRAAHRPWSVYVITMMTSNSNVQTSHEYTVLICNLGSMGIQYFVLGPLGLYVYKQKKNHNEPFLFFFSSPQEE